MLGWIAITGVAFVWLWLFAPDGVPDRLRKGLMTLSAVVLALSVWSTSSVIESHRQARLTAKRNYLRNQRQKREAVELMRRNNEDLGAAALPGD
ncbi:MAG: hypothetical protein ACO1SX_18280 [Actinomycetota bacterium]